MFKYIKYILIGFVAAAAQNVQAQTLELHVYNWSNYIDKNVIIDFEARHKISVNYQTYHSLSEVKEILKEMVHASDLPDLPDSSQTPDFLDAPDETNEPDEPEAPEAKKRELDVIILPGFLLKGLIEQNLLAPMRPQALRNDKNVFATLIKHLQQVSSEVGREDLFAMPYLWGTSGLAYNAKLLNKRQTNFPRQNWALLFDPQQASKFSDCGIAIADRPREVFQILRNYLGHRPQSTAAEHLTQAEIVLRKIRPYVEVMSGIDAANALAYGDACIAMAQSQEIFLAQQQALDIAQEKYQERQQKNQLRLTYKLPHPGSLLWMDMMIIPAQSQKQNWAHKWIDHVLDAENSRLIAEQTGFATPSRKAYRLLPEKMRASQTLYPRSKGAKEEIKFLMDHELLDANDLPDENITQAEERAWERFLNLKK